MITRLNNISSMLKANIYGFVGSADLSGSIKDRPARHMIEGLAKKNIKAGTTIVEGTAGNTGYSLGLYAREYGYKFVAVMPDKMSIEKIDRTKNVADEVLVVPTVPHDSEDHYLKVCKRIASERSGIFINQFNNENNWLAHYRETGPEIQRYFNGCPDYFICGIGTGGTSYGIQKYFRDKSFRYKNIIGEPRSSALAQIYMYGEIRTLTKFSIEGIGGDYVPEFAKNIHIDHCFEVDDEDAYKQCVNLGLSEKIYCGCSSGVQLDALIQLSNMQSIEGKNILVMLADHGMNYLSKIYGDC